MFLFNFKTSIPAYFIILIAISKVHSILRYIIIGVQFEYFQFINVLFLTFCFYL